jgi:hypothetical protein
MPQAVKSGQDMAPPAPAVAKPACLSPEIQAAMMPMVLKLGPVTPLSSGVGSGGMVLARINSVDSRA